MGVDCELGGLLRALRRERSVTQRDLARRSGVSARTIGDLETGTATAPRRSTLTLIADALDLASIPRARVLRHAADGNGTPAAAFPVNPAPPIGRAADIERLARDVLDGSARIHTLVGAGGVGKTTLAIEVARGLAAAFDGAIAFVALDDVEHADGVPSKILEALGTPDFAPMLARASDPRRLVVVDNFEHVVEAAPSLATIAGLFPDASFLVTSRRALGLRGERVHHVAALSHADGCRLFTDLAVRAGLAEALAAPDADEGVAGVCDALEGIPLAIELTVPLLRSTGLRELAARLRRRIPLHASGPRDAAKRHRSIAASLAWTFEELDATQRNVAFALALFVRPARIAWLAATASLSLDAAREAVAGLTSASLAQLSYDEDGEPRVRCFKMIRDYALERARAAERLALCRERHAAWLVAYGDAARARMSEAAVDDLCERATEIQDALEWAHGARRPHEGIALVNALLWPTRVHMRLEPEAMRLCARRISGLLDRYVASTEDARDAQARARNILAGLLMTLGENEAADVTMRAALARWIETGQRKREGDTVNFLAFIALNLGRYEEARALQMRVLEIAGELSDDSNFGSSALASSALTFFLLGDLAAAQTYWAATERRARERFPKFTELVRATLTYVRALAGDVDGASEALDDRIVAAEATDDDEMAFRVHAAAGLVANASGDDDAALAAFSMSFDRCVASAQSSARENAHVVALHLARFFAARADAGAVRVALCAAAALIRSGRIPIYPVYRTYFGALLDGLPPPDERDPAAAVRDLRALLRERHARLVATMPQS